MELYEVTKAEHEISGTVTVPGSKSVTNRALFMAAMAKGHSILRGVLFSDDSRHFIGSLKSLGYEVTVDEDTFWEIYYGNLPAGEDPQILAAVEALK